jgi:subtilisin family serine protease
MRKSLFTLLLLTAVLADDYYQDRILVYIDNAATQFRWTGNSRARWTNQAALNSLLETYQVERFEPWLPHARPEDHDGDVYLNRIYQVRFSTARSDLTAVIDAFVQHPLIAGAERVPVMRANYIPDDPRFNQQWYLPNIAAPEAWDLWDIDGGEIPGYSATRVIKVAVVDDGVAWNHQDLVGNIWNNLGEDANGNGMTLVQSGGEWVFDSGDLNGVDDDGDGYVDNLIGWDVASSSSGADDNDPMPVSGDTHGTMVSGCVAGVTNNGIGIASVGWSIKIMPIKSSYANNGYIDYGYDGILAAAQAGADVINCSWGGFGYSSYAQNLINVAHNQYGAIIVASAGNGNPDTGQTNFDVHYPSGYDNVISVTATGPGDHFNCWATGGTTVDLCAPGENIMTTFVNNAYLAVDGTSFSSPITAGAVGLLWSRFPDESQAWVEDRIISSTDYFPDMDRDCNVRNINDNQSHLESMTGMLGTGRLNIFKALAGGIFPSLVVQEVNLQSDTDGDGVFNPGETVNIKVVILNEEGWATATDVIVVLDTEDPRITILDNTIEFPNDIAAGTSAFTLFDAFQVSAAADAQTGPVPFTVTMYAGQAPNLYVQEQEISIDLSLTQANFPLELSGSVKTSPLVYDLDGDGVNEIYFGADDFNLYGVDPEGNDLPGFPFATDNQVRSSVAIGDLDLDGAPDLVFGSKDRHLYIVAPGGTQLAAYLADGYVTHTPVLVDLDGDQDLEVVFGTFEFGGTGQGGKLYAIHHDGTDVTGFPVDIGEIVMVAPAVGDLDRDGIIDIVVGTWSNNIYAVTADGAIRTGFPFATGNRVNVAPSLADVVGGPELEIIAGSDDGNLYIIDADGVELDRVSTGNLLRGGPSLHDATGDGHPEIFFGGYDRQLHAYNVSGGEELSGWPVSVSQNIVGSPAIIDLDNDGSVEVVGAMYGNLLAFRLDGTPVANFPIPVSGTIDGSPAVQDLDRDGDLEILIGTSTGLEVIDIKTPKGSSASWSFYRGNYHRTGNYEDALLAVEPDRTIDALPRRFSVSANYPNPFNARTTVQVAVPRQGKLRAMIFDLTGREVLRLMDRQVPAGYYTLHWSGTDQRGGSVPSGIYFLRVTAGEQVRTQKMLYVK